MNMTIHKAKIQKSNIVYTCTNNKYKGCPKIHNPKNEKFIIRKMLLKNFLLGHPVEIKSAMSM